MVKFPPLPLNNRGQKHKLLFVMPRLLSFFQGRLWSKVLLLAGMLMLLLSLLPFAVSAAPKQSSLEVQEVKSEFYQTKSGMSRIRDIDQLQSGVFKTLDLMLSLKSKIVMSEAQEQMLFNGIPLTFVYDIRIEEKGFWGFWKGRHYLKEIRYLLFYHGLSKQFVVRDLETKKQHSYPTLSLALLSISTLTDVDFRITDEAGIRLDRFQGQAKLWLDIEALPTPLRIPAYLSKHWWLNSSWFKWELKI